MMESQEQTEARNKTASGDEASLSARYDAPRLIRVRVQTARLVDGLQTANAHCTKHYHQNVGQCIQ